MSELSKKDLQNQLMDLMNQLDKAESRLASLRTNPQLYKSRIQQTEWEIQMVQAGIDQIKRLLLED